MSRKATNEYIGARRRAYADAKPEKRKVILDDVCDTTGYSRKYANRLLTGSRKFKERKGRGPTYTERDKAGVEQGRVRHARRAGRRPRAPAVRGLDQHNPQGITQRRDCVCLRFTSGQSGLRSFC